MFKIETIHILKHLKTVNIFTIGVHIYCRTYLRNCIRYSEWFLFGLTNRVLLISRFPCFHSIFMQIECVLSYILRISLHSKNSRNPLLHIFSLLWTNAKVEVHKIYVNEPSTRTTRFQKCVCTRTYENCDDANRDSRRRRFRFVLTILNAVCCVRIT